MVIILEKPQNRLIVLLDGIDCVEGPVGQKVTRLTYGPPEGMRFTLEWNEYGPFVSIFFDCWNDPEILRKIQSGQVPCELQRLWELAHLPCAVISTAGVVLPDGRRVELINRVLFELKKTGDWALEAERHEAMVDQRRRQMRLETIRKKVPGVCAEPAGTPAAERRELLLANSVPGSDPEVVCERCPAVDELKVSGYLTDPGRLRELQAEIPEKPTAARVNAAIQLLLWRCRDAEIHKNSPEGKRGFYKLDDWIAVASDDMIRELGLWCADIQEVNIGTRDS